MMTLKNISYAYDNNPLHSVIQNVNLTINEGEFIAIIGANGSGKSTLAKLMNGLITPTSGEILFNERLSITENDRWLLKQKIGMVFQNPDNQMVGTTVIDDVAFGLENLGVPPDEMLPRIKEALQKVNMWEQRDREPSQLSGGQKQRVAIASILAMQPDVLIFDESTSMLDPEGREHVCALMKQLHEEGYTIITITHDMTEALLAERVLMFYKGHIVKEGPPTDVFKQTELLLEAELDIPFAYHVLKELHQEGIEMSETIKSKEELVEQLWTLLQKN